MKFIPILFSVVTLASVGYTVESYGILGCDEPHCYALEQFRQYSIIGIEYDLQAPDLYIDRNTCLQNITVSTGWLISLGTGEWGEAGVTKGNLQTFDADAECVSLLKTYYAYNTFDSSSGRFTYTEFLVPDGRVDPGDNIDVKIENLGTNQIKFFINTPDLANEFATARINMNPENIYYADFGVEGTVSASDEYSSIPMSKFTNMKIKQNGSWVDIPSSTILYTPDTDEGYIGQKCTRNSFVAGTVTALDCSVVATRNQVPNLDTQVINLSTNSPYTINLDGTDTDKDYLIYHLVESPTNGFLDHVNKAQRIPNIDGNSAQLKYTPASAIPEPDTIRVSVTDGRHGHTRDGLVSIIGPTPSPAIPDPIDDFAYSLSDTTIHFTWSHPYNGGSDITHYKVERSSDTITWQLHNTYSDTRTSFDYQGYEGYDLYFRIFANNEIGYSAESNILHVRIPDTTPPNITIQNPSDGTTYVTSDVLVSGNVYEQQGSGIEDVKIKIDGVTSNDPIITHIIYPDTNVSFESTLTGLSNGDHSITVTADNGDGYMASKSTTVTIAAPIPNTLDSFSDDFEEEMSKWITTTQDDEDWRIRDSPIVPVPDSLTSNKVAGTEDCDNVCTMTMIDNVDLTQMESPKLGFYRFVSTSADIVENEGIIASFQKITAALGTCLIDSLLINMMMEYGTMKSMT